MTPGGGRCREQGQAALASAALPRVTLTAKVPCHPASLIASRDSSVTTPALLTRMSQPPRRCAASRTASLLPGSARSQTRVAVAGDAPATRSTSEDGAAFAHQPGNGCCADARHRPGNDRAAPDESAVRAHFALCPIFARLGGAAQRPPRPPSSSHQTSFSSSFPSLSPLNRRRKAGKGIFDALFDMFVELQPGPSAASPPFPQRPWESGRDNRTPAGRGSRRAGRSAATDCARRSCRPHCCTR